MAKEKMFFSVEVDLTDADFQEVYQIYLNTERNKDRKAGLLTSIALFGICMGLLLAFQSMMFLIYGLACLVIGAGYFCMPVNRKFIATNRLQLGERRETCFYPHSMTSEEKFDDAEQYEDSENGVTEASTLGLIAYESERGFLFADGKITNQFFYLPKRQLSETMIGNVSKYAKERCSGGYHEVKLASMLGEDPETGEPVNTGATDAVCRRYYGAEKLRVCDECGNRIDLDDEEYDAYDAYDEQPEETAEEADPTALDVDAALEEIIGEGGADE